MTLKETLCQALEQLGANSSDYEFDDHSTRARDPHRSLAQAFLKGIVQTTMPGADMATLNALAVDELVIQSYQGRHTVDNYQAYLPALTRLRIPFKLGLVQGGIQSLSRSYFGRLVPEGKSSEFFGFYNMMGKASAIVGPILVGVTAAVTHNQRLSILSILLLFVYGMVGWSLFGAALPESWGTIGRSMLTLFILLTLENFPTYLEAAEAVSPYAIVFFISYVLLAAFVVATQQNELDRDEVLHLTEAMISAGSC